MMLLSEAAEAMNAAFSGSDREFMAVSIDSRQLEKDELFFAIAGDRFDGHQFLEAVHAAGAAAAVVSHEAETSAIDPTFSLLKVRDTTEALGLLASHWRRQFSIPVLGITGSNGKTTVTGMVSRILSGSNMPLAPKQSFNNQWGVPLTLLDLRSCHSHAVIEMGMNHRGEIDYLTRIAQPTVALINNAAAAHLEGLGSVREVALAKAEIINGLAADGTLILNADDDHVELWRELAGGIRVLEFGLSPAAAVSAQNIELESNGSRFDLVISGRPSSLKLPVGGKHNICNALAAAALCHAAGVDHDQIVKGLEDFEAVTGRQRRLESAAGALLIDDSFNANPGSMIAAIDVLSTQPGKHILVLGAMAELGANATALHEQVAAYAKTTGIDRLLVLADSGGAATDGYVTGFGNATERFENLERLVNALAHDNHAGVTILVKGSKSSRMGRVVDRLVGEGASSGKTTNSSPAGNSRRETMPC